MRESLGIFYFRHPLRIRSGCGAAVLPTGGAVDLSLRFATTLQVFSYFRGFGTTALLKIGPVLPLAAPHGTSR